MSLLKEFIGSVKYYNEYDTAFEEVISLLRKHSIEIINFDKKRGIISLEYITKVFDMLIWRCWSKRAILELEKIGDSNTNINVFCIPNLFKIKVGKTEQVRDRDWIIRLLRREA